MTIMDLSLSQLSDEASHESSDSQDVEWAPGPGEDMTPLDAFVLGFTRDEGAKGYFGFLSYHSTFFPESVQSGLFIGPGHFGS